ncbi:MAG: hypothetical protein OM95_03550 [Bdellovibrio sp. ArHS]|uniref:hypothetical protein n=1 Tax=Bdellovibrio sp. ArHS TaxID=1569284 RepID=UPI000582E67B|nr:hypothetical protein [Bdellovibrio sp. ArHS]KHD89451.1 MAG: hypothetical protein OM95_03550 [Bdellovibrio sp. ArHS]
MRRLNLGSHIVPALVAGSFIFLLTSCLNGKSDKKSQKTEEAFRYSKVEMSSYSVSPSSVEILQDPRLTLGVAHGFANTLSEFRNSECSRAWDIKLPSLMQAPWLFWEIAEKTYFCDNASSPQIRGREISYASADLSKRFIIPNDSSEGAFRMIYDTSKEWRKGCNLSKPDGNLLPRYPHPATQWPHFLIGQLFEDPRQPQKNLWLNAGKKYTLRASVRLNESQRMMVENCPQGSWPTPGNGDETHQIFYIALILKHKNHPRHIGTKINVNQIYALAPVFYSPDGTNHLDVGSWVDSDQFGNAVHFAPGYPQLRRGSWVDVQIDADAMTQSALNAIQEKYGETLRPDDYHVLGVLIGWEIWGGFKNDIEVKNLSFQATDSPPPPPPSSDPSYGTILGHIDGLSSSGSNYTVNGWACGKSAATSIPVHLYLGGQAGTAQSIYAGAYQANLSSESAISSLCGTQGIPHRFAIPVSKALAEQHATKPLFVHGISPSGRPNAMIGNSGNVLLPPRAEIPPPHAPTPDEDSGIIRGFIDGIEHSGTQRALVGWACGTKISTPIQIHLYVGSSAGTPGATLIGGYTANQPSEPAVAQACASAGNAHRFKIPLSAELSQRHAGKRIYIHGISPTGKSNDLLGTSKELFVP